MLQYDAELRGVGKTHLAVALALKAIEAGYGVYFVRAHDLVEDLRRAMADHRRDRRLRVYLAPKLLIIDEFGVWPYDRMASTALFTLISARYERGSILLISNKGFAEWGEVLGDFRDGHPGPAAAPQPRHQHPGRKLPASGEAPGGTVWLSGAVGAGGES